MRARDVMTSNIGICEPEDTLRRAAQIMKEKDCGCVPVTDSMSRVLGMVTDRDVCMAAYTSDLPLSSIHAVSAMSRDPRTCKSDDRVEKVEALMKAHQVRRLPVVDSENRLLGIVSLNDLALIAEDEEFMEPRNILDKQRVAETLAGIGRHRPAALPDIRAGVA